MKELSVVAAILGTLCSLVALACLTSGAIIPTVAPIIVWALFVSVRLLVLEWRA
jgi:hypothetical protein